MQTSYGVPHIGSKNSIAKWVVEILPPAKHFYDLFGGGGAITHAAILSGKFDNFHINDNNEKLLLFADAIRGKYNKIPNWVSNKKFHSPTTPIYEKTIYSYGNNGVCYLYSPVLEHYQELFYRAIILRDYEEYEKQFSIKLSTVDNANLFLRLESAREMIKAQRNNLPSELQHFSNSSLISLKWLEAARRIANLSTLKPYAEKVNFTISDYQDVPILQDSVIYCDPPYLAAKRVCTRFYKQQGGFNYDRFYCWAQRQQNIFISEYEMPPEFVCIAEKKKKVTLAQKVGSEKIERLFIPRRNKQFFIQQTLF